MAVIQKLRNSGVVIIVIIAALVIFVIGDILTGNRMTGLGNEDQDLVGTIFGEDIKEKDLLPVAQAIFQQQSENDPNYKLDEKTQKQIFDQAWSDVVRQRTFEAQIEKAGLTISDPEFSELMTGPYPLEAIKGDPSFQTDGKFDPKKVEDIFRQAKSNASLRSRLAVYVGQIKKQTLESRYSLYISKAQRTSKAERQHKYVVDNQGAYGKVVTLNYSTIADKDVKITDKDLEKYLNEHKEEYKQPFESRDIQYVLWDIIPSRSDSAYALEQANGLYKSMVADTKPDTAGEGVIGFVSRGKLPEDAPKEVAEQVWPSPLLSVVGPFYKDGKYSIYQKVAEKRDTMPVTHVAHILISFKGEAPNKTSITDTAQAKAKAEELAAQVRGGADISKLASEWSMDPGSANLGGDYGWQDPSQYVPEYKDFCLRAKKGQVEVVRTSFGFHVMKALDDPDNLLVKYRVKTVEVTPGSETVKLVDQASRKFRNLVVDGDPKSFETAVSKSGVTPRIRKDLRTEEKVIPGMGQAEDTKQLLGWLFDKERQQNNISDVFAFSSQHIVVLVSNVRHKGYAEVKDVKDKIEPLVRNEIKGRMIAEKFEKALADAKTPEALSQKVGGALVPIEGVKMGTNFIPQLFNEPKILGAMFGVKEKTLSNPIAGSNVVAVLWIEKKDKVEVPKTGMDAAELDFVNQPQFISNRVQEALRKAAEITDVRYKFPWN